MQEAGLTSRQLSYICLDVSGRMSAQAFQLQCPSAGGLGRGMACVAGFMLVVMGPEREEDAFWTLVGLVEDRLPHSCVLQVPSSAQPVPVRTCPSQKVECRLEIALILLYPTQAAFWL